MLAVISPCSGSFAVAPGSTNGVPTCIITGVFPFRVITGIHPVFTFTVRVLRVAAFPARSLTSNVRKYVPATAVFTVPLAIINPPLQLLSVHVAPESEYIHPIVIFTVVGPTSDIVGGSVSIINEGIFNMFHTPPPSSTPIVHVLYVPSNSVSKVIVLLPTLAEICIIEEQGHPYAILHAASDEKV